MQSFAKGLAICLVVAFVGLAIAGGVNNFSPVPYWDMWDGYLGFFTQLSQGDWSVWWAQHNEHRIVLSRILFWIDLAWLDGAGWFLILTNYLLVAASVVLFWVILKEQISERDQPPFAFLLGAFLCMWLFSWIQHENLTWGFQSQFILAQLVPLAAFYCLYKASGNNENRNSSFNWRFIIACLLGVASLGTMANGILVLPIMVAMAIALRLPWQRTIVLTLLAIVGCLLYFHDYHSVATHGSLKQALLEHPRDLAAYTLLYLGGPFYYFMEQTPTALRVAAFMGLFMILSCVGFAYRAVRMPHTQSLNLALLAFLLYIGGTAFGTASGRVVFSIHTTSRYMTPALMAWAALLVLYVPSLLALYSKNKILTLLPLFLLIIWMTPSQMLALRTDSEKLFEHRVAALAIAMRIHDDAQIHTVFPSTDFVIKSSEYPLEKRLSVFGIQSISDGSRLIGQQSTPSRATICTGNIETVEGIENENRYARVQGWIYNPEQEASPRTVHILDSQGIIVGYALVGQPRPDIASSLNTEAEHSGFKGYLLSTHLGQDLIFQGVDPSCAFLATASDTSKTQ